MATWTVTPSSAGGVRQRRRDVVAVADEGDAAAAQRAPALLQRQHVGQRLTRMLLVAQRVDDVQPRRRGGDRRDLLLRVGPHHQARATHRSRLRATSSSGSRVPSANSDGHVQRLGRRARLTAISKVERVRSDGFSNSMRDVPAGERRRGRRLARRAGDRPSSARPARAARRDRRADRSRTDRKSFARRRRRGLHHVRYSPLMRTYSALRSHRPDGRRARRRRRG